MNALRSEIRVCVQQETPPQSGQYGRLRKPATLARTTWGTRGATASTDADRHYGFNDWDVPDHGDGCHVYLTLQVLKGYVFALIWLQTWPLLFAILNSAMAYAKQNGVPVLSELSQVQLKNSDIATTGLYLLCRDDTALVVGDREEHWGAFSGTYPGAFFFIGAQCNIAGCLRRGGQQLLFRQHADGERQRLQLGYQQYNQFRTDVAAAGEWGHEHADAGWIDGLGQWWCNVKLPRGYQRRSSDSQCSNRCRRVSLMSRPKARCMAITAA